MLAFFLLGFFSLFFFSSEAAAGTSSSSHDLNGTLPGCQAKCGNLSIPYPFGISNDCHLPGFKITCNDTDYDPPQAFLDTSNIKVFNISDDVVTISTMIANCNYNYSMTSVGDGSYPYTFSQSNVLTAIGCDTLALFYDSSKPNYSISGCVSICSDKSSIANGACLGNGCCQSSIPPALKRFDISLLTNIDDRIRNMAGLDYSKPIGSCSKAFLVDKDKFVFQASFIDNFNLDDLPAALDWAIGDQPCEVARKLANYTCKEDSTCVDSTNGPGYRCKCLTGFQGNPYLNGSCQDVDECADPKTNHCQMICVNKPGNYECACQDGYFIDEHNSTACIKKSKDKSRPLQIVIVCAVGFFVLLMVGVCLLYWVVRRRN